MLSDAKKENSSEKNQSDKIKKKDLDRKLSESDEKNNCNVKKDRKKEKEKRRSDKLLKRISDEKLSESESSLKINVSDPNVPCNQNQTCIQKSGQFMVPVTMRMDDEKVKKKWAKKLAKQQVPLRHENKPKHPLVSHLIQYESEIDLTKDVKFTTNIHCSMLKLGIQLSKDQIIGSTEKCVAFIKALEEFLRDYRVAPGEEMLPRDVIVKLSPSLSFLNQCRPIEIGMGNIIKHLKMELAKISENSSEKLKEKLLLFFKDFVKDKITVSKNAILDSLCDRIKPGDVILTFAHSGLLMQAFRNSKENLVDFSVIVIDSKPRYEGRKTVKELVDMNIKTTYSLLNGLSGLMPGVKKVYIEADGVLANGTIVATTGASMVAMVAKSQSIPVMVLCESFKFTDRAYTDGFVYNVLGDPDDIFENDEDEIEFVISEEVKSELSKLENFSPTYPHTITKENWKKRDNLKLVNFVKDLIPPCLITAIVTDVGIVPPNSAPSVYRVKNM